MEMNLGVPSAFCSSVPGLGAGRNHPLYTAWSLLHTPRPSRVATNCGSFGSPNQVAQVQSQTISDIDLHQRHSQEDPEPKHSVASFKRHQRSIQLASQVSYPKRELGRYQTLLRQIPLWVVSNCQQLIHCGWV